MNHNQLLNVSQGASESEIQKAFRKAALEIHPDHNNGPEAAEAFARIKEARDKLLEEAKQAGPAHDAATIQTATATAVRASTNAAYTSSLFDIDDDITPEELAHIQKLDALAMEYAKQSRLKRRGHSDEVKRHWRKINTTNRRVDGKY